MITRISGNNQSEDIISCLQTLYSTPKGSVPCDRDFGIDMSLQDLPINLSKAKLVAEITQATKKYEPRIQVDRVLFDIREDGELIMKVVVK